MQSILALLGDFTELSKLSEALFNGDIVQLFFYAVSVIVVPIAIILSIYVLIDSNVFTKKLSNLNLRSGRIILGILCIIVYFLVVPYVTRANLVIFQYFIVRHNLLTIPLFIVLVRGLAIITVAAMYRTPNVNILLFWFSSLLSGLLFVNVSMLIFSSLFYEPSFPIIEFITKYPEEARIVISIATALNITHSYYKQKKIIEDHRGRVAV